MKSKFSIILLLVAFITLLLTACTSDNNQSQISKELGVDCSSGKIEFSKDTHGGFHGDGTTFVVLEFSDDEFENTLKELQIWSPLPLSENIITLIYGAKTDHSLNGPYIGEDGAALFPKIENGYYFYYDRQSDSKDSADDADVLTRSSFNFTIAVYDSDTNKLYFGKLDT